jgi:hypothetical protein
MENVVSRIYIVLSYIGSDVVQVMYQMKCNVDVYIAVHHDIFL